LHATADEAGAIRAAVREARGLELLGGARRLARAHDAAALALFLSVPAVSDPIYDLPRPFTEANVGAWIEEREARHARGEGALLFVFDSDGSIISYADVAVWPERVRRTCRRSASGSPEFRPRRREHAHDARVDVRGPRRAPDLSDGGDGQCPFRALHRGRGLQTHGRTRLRLRRRKRAPVALLGDYAR
jgi:hypothetical protein